MAISRGEDGVRFWALSIPWTSSERDGDDACDVSPDPSRPRPDGWQGRGIGGQLLARLIALADPERPIPVSTEASADRVGGYLVVLVDGWRILGLWGLRRRREY